MMRVLYAALSLAAVQGFSVVPKGWMMSPYSSKTTMAASASNQDGDKNKLNTCELKFTVNEHQDVSSVNSTKLLNWVSDNKFTDLLVLSHGWNTGERAARKDYEQLLKPAEDMLKGRWNGPDRKVGIIEIIWPSLKWYRGDDDRSSRVPLNVKASTFDEIAGKLPDGLKDECKAAQKAVKAISQVPPNLLMSEDAAASAREEEKEFMRAVEAIVNKAVETSSLKTVPIDFFSSFADEGEPNGNGPWYQWIVDAFFKAINLTTFYKMTDRAARTGVALASVLNELAPPPRLHLAGHSFGGLLVSAAANKAARAESTAATYESMMLMQAAFGHYGYGKLGDGKDGRFRAVIDSDIVKGPLVVTQTKNDNALAIAYPLVSIVLEYPYEYSVLI
jgi:hypothetical protein